MQFCFLLDELFLNKKVEMTNATVSNKEYCGPSSSDNLVT